MSEMQRVKVDLRIEILDGPDAGYTLEEHNKIFDLNTLNRFSYGYEDWKTPYNVTVEFFVPEQWRERRNR